MDLEKIQYQVSTMLVASPQFSWRGRPVLGSRRVLGLGGGKRPNDLIHLRFPVLLIMVPLLGAIGADNPYI